MGKGRKIAVEFKARFIVEGGSILLGENDTIIFVDSDDGAMVKDWVSEVGSNW